MSEPLRVLFVCTANICRSPTMELLARDLADAAGPATAAATTILEVASAGTHGRDGEPMNPEMVATLPAGAAAGAAAFRSRHLTTHLLTAADLVLTAEDVHRRHVLDDHPQLHRRVFTLGQLAATIEALDAAEGPALSGHELARAAGQRRSPAMPEHDVADPYRRGAAAAEAATATISAMLSAIVPRLVGTHHPQHQEG